ncbi:hypothetical protein BDV35DRAFT_379652 [Aspergillus flavus]|uniref:Uncharacterized protein n=1 Tax=Aspergillus flavus TaxID=5059 RepID=A0A5N6H501_ASPFL|nr:hypothetical protein BDV35DRAFT_379652 [Aspergillus flavus]
MITKAGELPNPGKGASRFDNLWQAWHVVFKGYYAFVGEDLATSHPWLINKGTRDSFFASNLEIGCLLYSLNPGKDGQGPSLADTRFLCRIDLNQLRGIVDLQYEILRELVVVERSLDVEADSSPESWASNSPTHSFGTREEYRIPGISSNSSTWIMNCHLC